MLGEITNIMSKTGRKRFEDFIQNRKDLKSKRTKGSVQDGEIIPFKQPMEPAVTIDKHADVRGKTIDFFFESMGCKGQLTPEFMVTWENGRAFPLDQWCAIATFHKLASALYDAETVSYHKWIPSLGKYIDVFPHQKSSFGGLSVSTDWQDARNKKILADFAEEYGVELFPCCTIHTHVNTSAFQSGTDMKDEEENPGWHITLGKMNQNVIDVHARLVTPGVKRLGSMRKQCLSIETFQFIDGMEDEKDKRYLTPDFDFRYCTMLQTRITEEARSYGMGSYGYQGKYYSQQEFYNGTRGEWNRGKYTPPPKSEWQLQDEALTKHIELGPDEELTDNLIRIAFKQRILLMASTKTVQEEAIAEDPNLDFWRISDGSSSLSYGMISINKIKVLEGGATEKVGTVYNRWSTTLADRRRPLTLNDTARTFEEGVQALLNLIKLNTQEKYYTKDTSGTLIRKPIEPDQEPWPTELEEINELELHAERLGVTPEELAEARKLAEEDDLDEDGILEKEEEEEALAAIDALDTLATLVGIRRPIMWDQETADELVEKIAKIVQS